MMKNISNSNTAAQTPSSDRISDDLDPWHVLRAHTDARIGLGRVGDGLPTARLLEFQMAHARARDSVHMAFDEDALVKPLADQGYQAISVQSASQNRSIYLQRPDLGRKLDDTSKQVLQDWRTTRASGKTCDVAFILADGLSARATMDHGATTVLGILKLLDPDWQIAPIIIAHQARVGLGDEIGEALGAKLTVMLIGERPGLSSADSLGAYLTWGPKSGRSNADRNCVSNIRPAGLKPELGAKKIAYLMAEAHKMQVSGVALKDNSTSVAMIEQD